MELKGGELFSGDLQEIAAMQHVFGGPLIPFSSNVPFVAGDLQSYFYYYY